MKNMHSSLALLDFKKLYKTIQESFDSLDKQFEDGLWDSDDIQRQKDIMNKKLLVSVKKLHNHPITQGKGKDTRFVTYFDLPSGGRKPIRKKTEEEVLEVLVGLYGISDKPQYTIKSLYEKWIKEYANIHRNAPTSITRVISVWNSFYDKDEIIYKDFLKLTYSDLKSWALKLIATRNLTAKAFSNIFLIMRGCYDCAIESGICSVNIARQVKLPKSVFYQKEEKPENLQCFSESEQNDICSEAWKDFQETGSTVSLGIILCFFTGCRSGEIVALKSTDIVDGKLQIRRQEIDFYDFNDETLKCENYRPQVVNHTKSYNKRDITLIKVAESLIETISSFNEVNGLCDDNYLFLDEFGARVNERAFDYRIRKFCNTLGIPERSLNKERKTFISNIANSPYTSVKDAQREAGHKYLSTTMNNYYKDTKHDEDKRIGLENTFKNFKTPFIISKDDQTA